MSAKNLIISAVFAAAGLSCATAAEPDAAGEKLVRQYCVSCHPIETVLSRPRAEDEWTEVILRMIDHGLNASPEELETIRDYLVAQGRKPGATSPKQTP
jgi:hypothetical protein